MENPIRYSRVLQHHSPTFVKQSQGRSGYEPSDTENEWHERNKRSPDFGTGEPNMVSDQGRDRSSLRLSRRHSAKFESDGPPPLRRHSKSPYKSRRDDGRMLRSPTPHPDGSELRQDVKPLPLPPGYDFRRNTSPFSKSERRRPVSAFKPMREDRLLDDDGNGGYHTKPSHRHGNNDSNGASVKPNYSHRSVTAPRLRPRMDQQTKYDHREAKREERYRMPSTSPRNITPRIDRESTHSTGPSVGEINEMVANAKRAKSPMSRIPNYDSTDSIAAGDIFFSRNFASLKMQDDIFLKQVVSEYNPSPKVKQLAEKITTTHQRHKGSVIPDYSNHGNSSSTVHTRTSMNSTSAVSNGSDASGKSTGSFRKFTINRQMIQTEAWFSCIKKGSCRTTQRSPEKGRAFDEASFIEKAFVVESIRQFWADKYRPSSLSGFTIHKQQAQQLKELVSQEVLPHILLKGPRGSGKKSLTMALLHEIYGDVVRNISHDLRYFQIQETVLNRVVVPLASSAYHVELNVCLEANASYALMAIMKQISSKHGVTPEISTTNFKADYTAMVLYDVDRANEGIQHLVKWIMDCYTDICKLILCCEDDLDILESVKTRCKVITVDAPVTHEIMEVLIQIARKENFDLPTNFAAKIANKSKQNLRRAIMALEACKYHNYPFVEDQPIPMGWEEVLVDLAAEILADPSNKRLFLIRGKLQKLLVEFIHPKLILLKLVEQFLKAVEASMKRELYYWHAYYDKRLPVGTSALLKLEEFVAKFMSIHRKSFNNSR